MPKFRVRYTGQDEEEIEAVDQGMAELIAAEINEHNWIAEEIYEEDENG